MAIFGNLSELPFPDVISMLGRRCGTLRLSGLDGHADVILHVDEEHLLALHVGPTALRDTARVREVFLDLTRAERGAFEFTRTSPNDTPQHHRLPLNKLLLATTAVIDEIDHYRASLPSADTRFLLVEDPQGTLDAPLQDFLDRTQEHLTLGASATDVARAIGMHVEQAQLHLYKLRALGHITPVRAYSVRSGVSTTPTTPTTPTAAHVDHEDTPRGLIGRLLAALNLRRRAA